MRSVILTEHVWALAPDSQVPHDRKLAHVKNHVIVSPSQKVTGNISEFYAVDKHGELHSSPLGTIQ